MPPVLLGRFVTEPKWVDLRAYRDGADPRDSRFIEAGADFAAAIHGLPKEDLLSQEVRQQRRTLTLAWSAAASLLVLAGAAGWQWWEAERAKEIVLWKTNEVLTKTFAAQRNLEVANEAAERTVERLVQNLRNLSGMRPEVSLQVLDSLQTMLDELDRESPDKALLQRTRGMVLHQFAATYREMRDFVKAREAAEQGVELARVLAKKFPGDANPPPGVEFHRDLTVQLDMLGDVCLEAGDQACAITAYEGSLAQRRRLVAIAPGYDELQRDLSVVLSSVGYTRRKAGDIEGALALYTEALGIDRKRVAADPADNARQRDLGYTLLRLGDLQRHMADKAAAIASYEESLAIRRKLAADESNTQAQYESE